MEQGENTKDDTSKVDDNSTSLDINGHNESKSQSSEEVEQDCLEPDSEQAVDSDNDSNFRDEPESTKSKEDYSACIKLIEKFQEAVLDNAVRVIQAAFKRFLERRRFLKLRKAATVIQRSVRRWLGVKHTPENPNVGHLAINSNSEQNIEMQRNCSSSEGLVSEVAVGDVECYSKEQQKRTLDENDLAEDALCSNKGLNNDDNLEVASSEDANQFENSFESLDVSSMTGSRDDVSDAVLCMYQCDEVSRIVDPDSLSLADSGIDMGSDIAFEATNVDDCKLPSRENPLLVSSNVSVEETTSQQ